MPGYVYDSAGNLTAVKGPYGGSTNIATYSYTNAGLLDTATYGGRTLNNTWDAGSNRVKFTVADGDHFFVYDTTAGIPAVVEESSGTTTVYYIREPGGELIARVHPTQGVRYYYFDELGSTRLLTDGSGTVTDRYAYDAYGSMLAHDRYTGSVNQPYQYVGQLGYYTHYQEPEFRLLQLGVRFYDAEVGRFTQRDPVRDHTRSSYPYCHDSPLLRADPSGQIAPIVIIGAGAAMTGACAGHCRNCLYDARRNAIGRAGEVRRRYRCRYRDDGDEINALQHCLGACYAAKSCGWVCSRGGVDGRELWPWLRRDRALANMDLRNNGEGFACAGESNCYKCCMRKLKAGDLIHVYESCKEF